MTAPKLTWVFAVNSGVGLRDREEHVSAPVGADFYELELGLFRAGYIRVNLLRKEWGRWAWPGGYPLFYLCADGGVLCSKCVNTNIKLTSDPDAERDWKIVAADINYEDPHLVCDHCGEYCESAYCEPVVSDGGGESDDAYALASAGHGTDEDYGSAEDML
jgi:hypothetical protein